MIRHTLSPRPLHHLALALAAALAGSAALAEVSLPKLFSDHMVLQRDKPIAIWGKARPGEAVQVEMAGNQGQAVADAEGKWTLILPALPAGGPHTMTVSGQNAIVLQDVLVGEVWIASGQSNMQWAVNNSVNADLFKLTAGKYADIRFNQVWNEGSQYPQDFVTNSWTVASAQEIGKFSVVAYAFAMTLRDTLGVPVGVIQNAWGGSAAEAWVDRKVIMEDPVLQGIHEEWLKTEANYDFAAELKEHETKMDKWRIEAEAAKAAGKAVPAQPRKPQNRMIGQHRPGNLWNGRLLPIAPYTCRGVIWYQGEANAHSIERALQYEHLFSTLIREWRGLWQEDFPFYWVQLADFREESEFSENETWAYLRHSQTRVLNTVENTGQAVITDLGEGKDIHPRHKEEVGRRLARWALNRDYGYTGLSCRSPEVAGWVQEGSELVVSFNHTGSGLRVFDTNEVTGFAIRDANGQWRTVTGRVKGKDKVTLEVGADTEVQAVAYAWANNPIANLFTVEDLPVTPFRTDLLSIQSYK